MIDLLGPVTDEEASDLVTTYATDTGQGVVDVCNALLATRRARAGEPMVTEDETDAAAFALHGELFPEDGKPIVSWRHAITAGLLAAAKVRAEALRACAPAAPVPD